MRTQILFLSLLLLSTAGALADPPPGLPASIPLTISGLDESVDGDHDLLWSDLSSSWQAVVGPFFASTLLQISTDGSGLIQAGISEVASWSGSFDDDGNYITDPGSWSQTSGSGGSATSYVPETSFFWLPSAVSWLSLSRAFTRSSV